MSLRRPLSRSVSKLVRQRIRQPILNPLSRVLGLSTPSSQFSCGSYAYYQEWLADDEDTVLDQRSDIGTTRPVGARAREFNGTNQHIETPLVTSLSYPISMFAWVYWTSTDSTIMSLSIDGSANNYHALRITSGGVLYMNRRDPVNNVTHTSSLTLTTNTWTNVGVILTSATDCDFYANGQFLETTTDTGVPLVAVDILLHGVLRNSSPTSYLDGRIWDSRFYNRALTPDEIESLFLEKHLALPNSSPLIHHRMEGNSDTIYNSGTGQDGIYINSTAASLHTGNDVPGSSNDTVGYGDDGGDIVPAATNLLVDANENSFTETGVAPANTSLSQSAAFTADGIDDFVSVPSLIGSETVVSNDGTSTVTISAGQIDFTAGTCWNLLLSNGSHYPLISETDIVYDTVNQQHGVINNGQVANWTTRQDDYHYGVRYGVDYIGQFDGTDDFIDLGDDDIYSFGDGVTDQPFSVSFYMQRADIINTQGIVTKSTTSSDGEWQIILASNVLFFRTIDTSTGGRLGMRIPIDDTPRRITCTYDGSSLSTGLKIYFDDTLQSAIDESSGTYTAMENTTVPLSFGKRGAQHYTGSLNDIKLFSKELTSDEVSNLHNGQQVSDLIGNWPLYEISGTTVQNVENNLLNGTLNGDDGSNFWKNIPVNQDGSSNVGRADPSHPATLGLNGAKTLLDITPIKNMSGTSSLPDNYQFGTDVDEVLIGIESRNQEANITLVKSDGFSFYWGTSVTDNPDTVSIGTLTEVIYTGTGQTIDITVNPPLGHYVILLVNTSNGLQSIMEQVLNRNVTDIFVETTNVRLLFNESYTSYVLGPSAGLASSDYQITLG